jgi:hypothetical protein
MQKWQYLTETVEVADPATMVKFDEVLDKLGEEGWELVSATYTVHPAHSTPGKEEKEPKHSFVYVFKRPKSGSFEQVS